MPLHHPGGDKARQQRAQRAEHRDHKAPQRKDAGAQCGGGEVLQHRRHQRIGGAGDEEKEPHHDKGLQQRCGGEQHQDGRDGQQRANAHDEGAHRLAQAPGEPAVQPGHHRQAAQGADQQDRAHHLANMGGRGLKAPLQRQDDQLVEPLHGNHQAAGNTDKEADGLPARTQELAQRGTAGPITAGDVARRIGGEQARQQQGQASRRQQQEGLAPGVQIAWNQRDGRTLDVTGKIKACAGAAGDQGRKAQVGQHAVALRCQVGDHRVDQRHHRKLGDTGGRAAEKEKGEVGRQRTEHHHRGGGGNQAEQHALARETVGKPRQRNRQRTAHQHTGQALQRPNGGIADRKAFLDGRQRDGLQAIVAHLHPGGKAQKNDRQQSANGPLRGSGAGGRGGGTAGRSRHGKGGREEATSSAAGAARSTGTMHSILVVYFHWYCSCTSTVRPPP